MATEVYGASDDLIEFEGDVSGEVGKSGTDDDDHPGVLLVFDDGTLLVAKYGKGGMGIWAITALVKGRLFDRIETCEDEDAERYSDTAYFKAGLKRAWAATEGWAVVD
jgi:hypothetical protein